MTKLSIGKQLITGTASLLALLLILGLTALTSLGSLRDCLSVIADNTARKIALAGEMNKNQALMLSNQRRMTLFATRKNMAAIEQERKKFKDLTASIQQQVDEIRVLLITEEGKEIAARITANLVAWQPEFDHIVRLCQEGKSDEAFQWAIDKTVLLSDGLDKDLNRLVAICNGLLAAG